MGEEEISFSDWRDGEPNHMYGCGHMTTEGQWTVAACNTKLNSAICEINTGKKMLQYISEWHVILFFKYSLDSMYIL